MKKWYAIFLASLLVLLAACGGTTEENTGSQDSSSSNEAEENNISIEEVLEKSFEKQNAVTSLSAVVDMETTVSYEGNGESYEETSSGDLTMDVVIDPLAMYMKGSMGMPDPMTGEIVTNDMEMYLVGDEIYVFESELGEWLKMMMGNYDEFIEETTAQIDVTEQLEEIKSFINDFKLEEKDTEYIITLDGAGEEFKKYMLTQLELYTEEELEAAGNEAIFEAITFDKLNYVIHIDKNSFDITELDMVVDITGNFDGETMKFSTDTKMKFTNYNGIDSIEVPQDVIDQAQEIDETVDF